MHYKQFWMLCAGIFVMAATTFAGDDAPVLRCGIIGTDTSHVPAFTEFLNNVKGGEPTGIRVVAAFPGGSADIPSSADRVKGYADKLKAMNIEIVDSVEALLLKVDVVLLESVDGRPHLQQAIPVLKAKKPMFIDKPLAGSLADAVEIFRLAKELNVPVWSSSSLRYATQYANLKNDPKVGAVTGCEAFGPCHLEPHHPDLFWYGIHGVEILYTIMGPGCVSVTRIQTKDTDVVVGVWKDGRIGSFRGIRAGKSDYGATVYGTKGIVPASGFSGYNNLVAEIAKFFKTKTPPVSMEETLEIYAFMEAADESKREGGKPVTIEGVMAKAKK